MTHITSIIKKQRVSVGSWVLGAGSSGTDEVWPDSGTLDTVATPGRPVWSVSMSISRGDTFAAVTVPADSVNCVEWLSITIMYHSRLRRVGIIKGVCYLLYTELIRTSAMKRFNTHSHIGNIFLLFTYIHRPVWWANGHSNYWYYQEFSHHRFE